MTNDHRLGLARAIVRFDEIGIILAVVVFFIVGTASSPYFLTVNNVTGILQNITFLGFLSIGVGLALMAGEIDISVGSVFGLTSVITALVLKSGYPLIVAVVAGLLVGSLCGLANGLAAQLIKVPVGGLPENHFFFDWFGQGSIGHISYITILFLIVALIAEAGLRLTSSGFRLLAIGSNPDAAHLVGYRVERTRVLLLTFSGFVSGLSGVCSVAYLNTAGPTGGTGYELSVLAATIIGGVKLTGGRGSILGVLLGLCVIGIFQRLIVLWGILPNWTQGVSGVVLIAAMTITWAARGRNHGASG